MKALIVDLDGTLLRSDRSVSPRTQCALHRFQQEQGPIVCATGRPRHEALKLTRGISWNGMICCNGSDVYAGSINIVRQPLSREILQKLIALAITASPRSLVGVETGRDFYLSSSATHGIHFGTENVTSLENLSELSALKFLVIDPTPEFQLCIAERFSEHVSIFTTDAGRLAQLGVVGVCKAWGARILLEKWQIGLTCSIGFGDDANDQSLLQQAGMGVAMGNACPKLKRSALWQTLSNDQDGVAAMLNQIAVPTPRYCMT